jgi:hypothetical protein
VSEYVEPLETDDGLIAFNVGRWQTVDKCDFCQRAVRAYRHVGFKRPAVCDDCRRRKTPHVNPRTVGNDVPLTEGIQRALARLVDSEL